MIHHCMILKVSDGQTEEIVNMAICGECYGRLCAQEVKLAKLALTTAKEHVPCDLCKVFKKKKKRRDTDRY